VLFTESADGTVAAYVWTALEWQGQHTVGRIWMTGVMPEFRRSGIGRSTVESGIKHLFAHGAAEVHLEVIEHNAGAVRIYTEMGFSETGRVTWYELEL
jgi:mycothiol synthase